MINLKNSKCVPTLICVFSLCLVLSYVFFERFGTYPNYGGGRFDNTELFGIILPLLVLAYPIFQEKYRENYWTKTNIFLIIVILIINIYLLAVLYLNREYYWKLWVESATWERNNCPPIRWDFWNIIGKSA